MAMNKIFSYVGVVCIKVKMSAWFWAVVTPDYNNLCDS